MEGAHPGTQGKPATLSSTEADGEGTHEIIHWLLKLPPGKLSARISLARTDDMAPSDSRGVGNCIPNMCPEGEQQKFGD